MRNKLYKLAIWYIGRCTKTWNKNEHLDLKSLPRLTYKVNNDKYYLSFGLDALWKNFARYDVLDNAIQRLGEYEDRGKLI